MDLTQTDLVIGSFQFANANINFDTCHYGCHGLIVSPLERFNWVAHYSQTRRDRHIPI